MKIWRLSDPFNYNFARACRVGGIWREGEYKTRFGVLEFEWERGAKSAGDFIWPGLDTELVVRREVGECLAKEGTAGFELREVKLHKVKRQFPADMSLFRDFWVTAWVRTDFERSDVTEGEENGRKELRIEGVERIDSEWDAHAGELVKTRVPRQEGKGLVVGPVRGVFRVEELPAWIFVTDDVKQLIEDRGWTNVDFFECGDSLA